MLYFSLHVKFLPLFDPKLRHRSDCLWMFLDEVYFSEAKHIFFPPPWLQFHIHLCAEVAANVCD